MSYFSIFFVSMTIIISSESITRLNIITRKTVSYSGPFI